MRKHELYTDYHDQFEYFGNTEIERIRKQGEKTIRHDWIIFDSFPYIVSSKVSSYEMEWKETENPRVGSSILSLGTIRSQWKEGVSCFGGCPFFFGFNENLDLSSSCPTFIFIPSQHPSGRNHLYKLLVPLTVTVVREQSGCLSCRFCNCLDLVDIIYIRRGEKTKNVCDETLKRICQTYHRFFDRLISCECGGKSGAISFFIELCLQL